MKTLQLQRPFELKKLTDDGQFAGYASVFDNTDLHAERVAPGAFAETLKDAQQKGRMPAMLWYHRPSEPIGVWLTMKEDKTGLWVEGQLALKTQRGAEAYELLKMGAVSGLSIGFELMAWEKDEKEKNVLILTKVKLWEVSLVTFPANDEARVAEVKAALAQGKLPTEREFEQILRDAGFSRKQATGIVADGYRALTGFVALRDAGAGVNTENTGQRDADVDKEILAQAQKLARIIGVRNHA
jgi:HK97 family phage prohead protease